MSAPTDKAWNFFLEHRKNIRSVVETFLAVAQWQSMVGPFGEATPYTLRDFDEAVDRKDTDKLSSIMGDVWGRAPEDRDVYRIPGFTEMCNLLDETVEGFFGEE